MLTHLFLILCVTQRGAYRNVRLKLMKSPCKKGAQNIHYTVWIMCYTVEHLEIAASTGEISM